MKDLDFTAKFLNHFKSEILQFKTSKLSQLNFHN